MGYFLTIIIAVVIYFSTSLKEWAISVAVAALGVVLISGGMALLGLPFIGAVSARLIALILFSFIGFLVRAIWRRFRPATQPPRRLI
jgi:hypothetical protein